MILLKIAAITIFGTVLVTARFQRTSFCHCAKSVIDCSSKSVLPIIPILSTNPTCKYPMKMNVTVNRLSFESLHGAITFPHRRTQWHGGLITYHRNLTSLVPALRGWVSEWVLKSDIHLSAVNLTGGADLLGVVLIGNHLGTLDVSSANKLRILYAERDYLHTVVLPSERCSLVDVYLYHNKFTSLPKGLSRCPELRTLGVTNNDILVLDPSPYLALTSLFASNIRNLTITSSLPSLLVLDIAGNKLTTLPADLTRIPYLQELTISNNNITWMDLSNFNSLRVVNASNSSIANWTPPVRNCSLQRLILDNNHLTSIPSKLTKCRNLTTLNLRNNLFSMLPVKCLDLLKLRVLEPNKNIKDSTVIDLDLRGNKISYHGVSDFVLYYVKGRHKIENHYCFVPHACECTWLSFIDRGFYQFAPVKICVSSMCDKDRGSLWKYV